MEYRIVVSICSQTGYSSHYEAPLASLEMFHSVCPDSKENPKCCSKMALEYCTV